MPDESTILGFRYLIETQGLGQQIQNTVNARLTSMGLLLKQGAVVDATWFAAPRPTKNASGDRDPDRATGVYNSVKRLKPSIRAKAEHHP